MDKKEDEDEITMVENENGEYVAEDEIKKPIEKVVSKKINRKRPMNYVYVSKTKISRKDFEEQFMGGFETGLRIVKRVNDYLKELK